jgi:hypothetical protein
MGFVAFNESGDGFRVMAFDEPFSALAVMNSEIKITGFTE